MEEVVHLIVILCSDGTMLAYNPDKTLNTIFTNLTSWCSLHNVYKLSKVPSAKRKGMDKNFNVKYIKYYFKNTQNDTQVEIPEEHIRSLLSSIKEG